MDVNMVEFSYTFFSLLWNYFELNFITLFVDFKSLKYIFVSLLSSPFW